MHRQKLIATRVFVCAVFCLLALRAQAQNVDLAASDDAAVAAASAPEIRPAAAHDGFLGKFWGRAPQEGIGYLPIGFHSDSTAMGTFHLTSLVYHSVYATGFRNSYGRPTFSLGLERNVADVGPVHVGYRLGVMAGYHGRLSRAAGVPFKHTFLFEHNLNPIFGFPTQVDIAPRVQLELFVNPLVTLFGVKIVPHR